MVIKMDLVEYYAEIAVEIEKVNKPTINVKRNNKLADKLRKIAKTIETENPELKKEFYELLDYPNSSVRGWCAHHIIELITTEDNIKKRALSVIIQLSTEDTSIGMGERWWLDDWYKEHPEDKPNS